MDDPDPGQQKTRCPLLEAGFLYLIGRCRTCQWRDAP